MSDRFVARLSRYLFEFHLVERNIYYCFFARFYNNVLERVPTRDRKLTVAFIFIKLCNMRRTYSQTIGADS